MNLHPDNRLPVLRLALPALAAVALLTLSCEQNTRAPFLTPTGNETGGTSFSSEYDAVQALGAFNNWNESLASMELVADGVWEQAQTVSAGSYKMKFRTDLAWDSPPDWGCCDGETCDQTVAVPSDGTEAGQDLCERTGAGGDIGPIQFPSSGVYVFRFDEVAGTFSVRAAANPDAVGSISGTVAFAGTPLRLPEASITVYDAGTTTQQGIATSNAATGAFLVSGLAPGSYDLAIRAVGYADTTITDIAVTAAETTSIGTITLDAGFVSSFLLIQALGEFNGWNLSHPSMELIADGVWSETQVVSAGNYNMKFRTNGQWDTPPDFGCCNPGTCGQAVVVPGDGSAVQNNVCTQSGFGGEIGPITFPVTGQYEFQLDEVAMTYSIRSVAPVEVGGIDGTVAFSTAALLLPVATVRVFDTGGSVAIDSTTSDAADGSWSLGGLPTGDYDVRFAAAGYVAAAVTGVHVNAPDTTSIGTVTLDPLPIGSLAGTISFSDNPSPRPTATVRVFTVNTTTQVGAGATNSAGAYSIGNLLEGVYDITVTAPDYQTQSIDSVSVVRQTVTTQNATLSPFTYQVVGDFNLWNSNAPQMAPAGTPGTFSTVTSVTAGCYRVKIRTNGDWDQTPDLGRCSGDVSACQIAVNPIQIINVCEGVGLADALGEVDFVNSGNYLFGLELRPTRRLTIQYLGP